MPPKYYVFFYLVLSSKILFSKNIQLYFLFFSHFSWYQPDKFLFVDSHFINYTFILTKTVLHNSKCCLHGVRSYDLVIRIFCQTNGVESEYNEKRCSKPCQFAMVYNEMDLVPLEPSIQSMNLVIPF